MTLEEQLIEAARSVQEREIRHALVHVAAVRESTRGHRRIRRARLLGRTPRPLPLRARPVATGSAITPASVALD
jgi:hypothetical protein